jgi:hypothetical protein
MTCSVRSFATAFSLLHGPVRPPISTGPCRSDGEYLDSHHVAVVLDADVVALGLVIQPKEHVERKCRTYSKV